VQIYVHYLPCLKCRPFRRHVINLSANFAFTAFVLSLKVKDEPEYSSSWKSITELVASPGFGARGHETKRVILLDRQPHGVKCQNLCGSEVTWKIKQLEVEGARVPVPHSWRRQCTELRGVNCHMGSHSVTCRLTADTSEREPQPSRPVLNLSTPNGWKAELTGRESNPRPLDRKSDALTLTVTLPSHLLWLRESGPLR